MQSVKAHYEPPVIEPHTGMVTESMKQRLTEDIQETLFNLWLQVHGSGEGFYTWLFVNGTDAMISKLLETIHDRGN